MVAVVAAVVGLTPRVQNEVVNDIMSTASVIPTAGVEVRRRPRFVPECTRRQGRGLRPSNCDETVFVQIGFADGHVLPSVEQTLYWEPGEAPVFRLSIITSKFVTEWCQRHDAQTSNRRRRQDTDDERTSRCETTTAHVP